MDLNGSSYLLNHATFPHVYYQGKDGENIIDLGLSLKVLQPESYHTSPHDEFEDLLDWNQLHPQLRNSKTDHEHLQTNINAATYYDEEAEGIQSKRRWSYHVKVNMDGIVVGRKICILDHSGYSTLALQLEEMFGKQSVSGLRLFEAVSEFSLLYKDTKEQWRVVGDVPWKEFMECVKRLRIVRKDAFSALNSL
ncbi:OLC1v1032211C1 [Oldenlandia corymbosa var. corymbosa]|uniref:Auxin-responsive protein n=1 Tax=Oldenlandia corymbosa var. corymbosa TaxID=529605 RepID=A0AAV1CKJ2_OLDCO|nr:OLC1v1032211C1 [Oldenlandia corymbosa var. corymbosa]